MKMIQTIVALLATGLFLTVVGCEKQAATDTEVQDTSAAAAKQEEQPLDEAALKAKFAKEAADSITEENAVAEAEALEKELDSELTQ